MTNLKNTVDNYSIEKARPTGCTCSYPTLVALGYPDSAIRHNKNCRLNDIRVNIKNHG